jgi:hypothetical protein|tara:strand:- start:446 stop:844 length:399 start_codon:yes stop_codon:yes gene_type:complete
MTMPIDERDGRDRSARIVRDRADRRDRRDRRPPIDRRPSTPVVRRASSIHRVRIAVAPEAPVDRSIHRASSIGIARVVARENDDERPDARHHHHPHRRRPRSSSSPHTPASSSSSSSSSSAIARIVDRGART